MKSLLATGLCLLAGLAFAQNADPPDYFDPSRFEADIRAFERNDSTIGYPPDAIMFYGSSSIRLWHDSLARDMTPLPVVPRGFGGSTMIDAVKYADRVVIPIRPRVIVLYEGDNDVGAFGVAPRRITELFESFVQRIHESLPETKIFFLSIKPSPSRWNHWPAMKETNRQIRAVCDDDSLLHYVDVASSMLGEDGKPKKEIFRDDMLHMNSNGYAIWREAIRSALGLEE